MSRAPLNPLSPRHMISSLSGSAATEYRVIRTRLQRILAFTGHSIDDVVNSSVARNHVRRYYKLSRLIDRKEEIFKLERQWNPTGRSR